MEKDKSSLNIFLRIAEALLILVDRGSWEDGTEAKALPSWFICVPQQWKASQCKAQDSSTAQPAVA